MNRFIKGLAGLLILVLIVVLIFLGYSVFLVDYSAETVAESLRYESPQSSYVAQATVYDSILRDLALEEAVTGDLDAKNVELLDFAVKAVSKSNALRPDVHDTVGRSDASETNLALSAVSRIADVVAVWIQRWQEMGFYLNQKIRGRAETGMTMSDLALLSEAEKKDRAWDLIPAIDLYKQFLENYPTHADREFVVISLCQTLLKTGRHAEAERILKDLILKTSSEDVYRIATHLLDKIEVFKNRQVEIEQLESQIRTEMDGVKKEDMRLRLGLKYLSNYALIKAQNEFKELESATDPGVRMRAKFYLAWIFQMLSHPDQGKNVLVNKLSREGLSEAIASN